MSKRFLVNTIRQQHRLERLLPLRPRPIGPYCPVKTPTPTAFGLRIASFESTGQRFSNQWRAQRCFATEAQEPQASSVEAQQSDTKKKAVRKKPKKPNRRKKTKKLRQFIQLRNLHPEDTLKQHFDLMAHRTELSKMKCFHQLLTKLQTASLDHESPWEIAETFMERKSVPVHIRDSFWNLIIAPTTTDKEGNTIKRKPNKRMPSTNVSKQDLQMLAQIRDLAVQNPLLWTQDHKNAIMREIKKEGKETFRQYQSQRAQALQKKHWDKDDDQRAEETQNFASTIRRRLPPAHFKKFMAEVKKLIESSNTNDGDSDSQSSEAETPPSKVHASGKSATQLYTILRSTMPTHLHLVVQEMESFFYLNEPTPMASKSKVEGDMATPSANESEMQQQQSSILADTRVSKLQDTWEEMQEDFAGNFHSIQKLLFDEHEKFSKEQRERKSTKNDSPLDDEGDATHDISEESVMRTFQDAAKNPSTGMKSTLELRYKVRNYIVFEAIPIINIDQQSRELETFPPLDLAGSPFEGTRFPCAVPNERLVVLDNLPIDITKNRLKEAYQRCGPIEDIKIFHQRAELDPGRKLDDSKKKIRKASGSRRQKWERPRTPVYAMVLFKNKKGASKATVDPLRIFGMVLDKHLIRSIRASDMTSLYLEDVSQGQDVTSMEYELSQILHPDLYVCLDVGRRQSRTYRTHCEIKFGSFEAAYWAYLKLSSELSFLTENKGSDYFDEDEDEEYIHDTHEREISDEDKLYQCQLHWMKTPKDAMHYWTRHLNF